MQIETTAITKSDVWTGKVVWICDYRQPDINKKPIRHIPPQPVLVRSNTELPANKKIYYSQNHFVKLNSKGQPTSTIYGVMDNTGYRSYTGEPCQIFDNQDECVKKYQEQADIIIEQYESTMANIVQQLENERNEVKANKMKF